MAAVKSLVLLLALSERSFAAKCGLKSSVLPGYSAASVSSSTNNSTSTSKAYSQSASTNSSSTYSQSAPSSASPDNACTSQYDSVSVYPIPTSSWTTTVTLTATEWVSSAEVTSTITPSPDTTTATETVPTTITVTANTDTDVVTLTSTDTSTITDFNTITETDTATTTVFSTSTSTSTVSAPAGFTPILENSDYVAKRDGGSEGSQKCSAGPSGPVFSPAAYIASVDCVKTSFVTATVTSTSTDSAPTATTTLSASTDTATVTITETSTSTEVPAEITSTESEFTTVTTTTTQDVTTTATVTSTSTVESVVPAATPYYEACGASNMLVTANGGNTVQQIEIRRSGYNFQVGSASSAYDCCVACQTSSTFCAGSFYANSCWFISATTCSPNSAIPIFSTTSGSSSAYILSTGPCGTFANGGNL
ncbi:hypothetical protein TruAng_000903 [Truncatella angustata]|nr:hypothetical protein TruAng_000903 [Truncatella angustata]